MKVTEARDLVLRLMRRDIVEGRLSVTLDPDSPDGDPGKFMLNGLPARAIHAHDGYYVNIDLDWFSGAKGFPRIRERAFYWYVFAIPRRGLRRYDHYFICDFQQMRSWVLEFAAPLGNDHRNHHSWRGDIHVLKLAGETSGLFRWGDESPSGLPPSRFIPLDNVASVVDMQQGVGTCRPGGEGEAHLLLKRYVADHPHLLGLAAEAEPKIEYPFLTGDRVDVLFENHVPNRSVVEVEVSGERQLIVGIHQALKYRTLAESDVGYPIQSPRVRPHVVAYRTDYPKAKLLASRYGVNLVPVQPSLELL